MWAFSAPRCQYKRDGTGVWVQRLSSCRLAEQLCRIPKSRSTWVVHCRSIRPLYKNSRAGADRGPRRDTRYRPRRGRWWPLLTMWSLNSRSVLSVCLCVWTVSVCIVHVIRAECPHEPSGKTLRRWSDASSWPSGVVSERALLLLLAE